MDVFYVITSNKSNEKYMALVQGSWLILELSVDVWYADCTHHRTYQEYILGFLCIDTLRFVLNHSPNTPSFGIQHNLIYKQYSWHERQRDVVFWQMSMNAHWHCARELESDDISGLPCVNLHTQNQTRFISVSCSEGADIYFIETYANHLMLT